MKASLCGGIILQRMSKGRVPQWLWQTLSQCFSSSGIIGESKIASDYMLQQADRLLNLELRDHIRQNCSNCIKALVSLTNIVQTHVIQENLLNDKNCNLNKKRDYCFRKFTASFHNSKAERYNLSRQEEVDYFAIVILNQCSYNSKTG